MTGNRGPVRGPVRVRLRRGRKKLGDGAPRPHPGRRRAAPRDTAVIPLRPEEPARFDPATLESLCLRIGEVRAEAEVARALERIATTISALGTLSRAAEPALMVATLRSLQRDADMIGMISLARVSRNVLCCLEQGDATGYSATLARLSRVGERSIHAVWELEDLSG